MEKYHRPVSGEEEEVEESEQAAAAVSGPGGAPGSVTRPAAGRQPPARTPAPPTPASPSGYAPLVRTPLKVAPPIGSDPLKQAHDREAREKFRAGQLQTLRDRVGALESRLAYLKARRDALLNPLLIAPQPQSETDRSREGALKPKEFLDQIDQEIAGLEKDLKATQEELVAIETRFGGAEGP